MKVTSKTSIVFWKKKMLDGTLNPINWRLCDHSATTLRLERIQATYYSPVNLATSNWWWQFLCPDPSHQVSLKPSNWGLRFSFFNFWVGFGMTVEAQLMNVGDYVDSIFLVGPQPNPTGDVNGPQNRYWMINITTYRLKTRGLGLQRLTSPSPSIGQFPRILCFLASWKCLDQLGKQHNAIELFST